MMIDEDEPKTKEEIQARVQATIRMGYPEAAAWRILTNLQAGVTLPGGLLPM